jgi:hypothetical protein
MGWLSVEHLAVSKVVMRVDRLVVVLVARSVQLRDGMRAVVLDGQWEVLKADSKADSMGDLMGQLWAYPDRFPAHDYSPPPPGRHYQMRQY